MDNAIQQGRARLTRIAFEALYGPFAWAYDWVSRSFFLGQWRLWQLASIRYLRGKRVLEVGMGTGSLQASLSRRGYQAWGVDLSPQMVNRTSAKLRRLGIEGRICRAQAQALPFPDTSFDSVVSTFPSDYIADAPTLREIARVLRPGGRLVVVPGGWLRPRDAQSKMFEGVARLVYGYKGSDYRPGPLNQVAQSGWHRWTARLGARMDQADFKVSAYVASNERGAALIIVGDKARQES